jgi:hypothetical protein
MVAAPEACLTTFAVPLAVTAGIDAVLLAVIIRSLAVIIRSAVPLAVTAGIDGVPEAVTSAA